MNSKANITTIPPHTTRPAVTLSLSLSSQNIAIESIRFKAVKIKLNHPGAVGDIEG